MTRTLIRRLFVGSALLLASATGASADTAQVAVAANFTDAAKDLAKLFAGSTNHEVSLSFGSTGQIFAQITQGAPYEVFLAADDQRPEKTVAEGLGVEGSVFTYAIGQLVLYSAEADEVTGADTLKTGDFDKIAIAKPDAAPYGAAAVETMKKLDLYETLEPKIVQGTSIGQTYQFVESGNAEIGFVALGQVIDAKGGSRWDVPQDLYTPIRQDAVLLKTGENNPAAIAFIDFLKSAPALEIIHNYGYKTGE